MFSKSNPMWNIREFSSFFTSFKVNHLSFVSSDSLPPLFCPLSIFNNSSPPSLLRWVFIPIKNRVHENIIQPLKGTRLEEGVSIVFILLQLFLHLFLFFNFFFLLSSPSSGLSFTSVRTSGNECEH